MKPFTALSSILLASAIAVPAYSATLIDGRKVPVPTPRPVEMAQVSPDTMQPAAPAPAQPSDRQSTDMMSTGSISPGVSGMGDFQVVDVTKIAVQRVDEIADEDTRQQYRMMSDDKADDVQKLQSDIRSNPDLVAALEAQQVKVEHILSVQQNGDGSVTFIVM
ncbi:hypothetical protein SAMN05892877_10783 [Rhizobium subbaraonis]|uniref:Uncharacterized protein n=1 Tax=Rhizobium subbaraonis TaxID=908946 RepID=A0A285UFS6_9HYPH|nr:hypothetical protein [Rhizobium subbaraonis]SOC40258.1 hypothetical protein SAMN05892877_10783 [Rhizobium subbaraonis]